MAIAVHEERSVRIDVSRGESLPADLAEQLFDELDDLRSTVQDVQILKWLLKQAKLVKCKTRRGHKWMIQLRSTREQWSFRDEIETKIERDGG